MLTSGFLAGSSRSTRGTPVSICHPGTLELDVHTPPCASKSTSRVYVGTTHILFTPQDFVARLAALVPRPRANLTRYHGVFAPNSPFRKAIVPSSPKPTRRKPKQSNERKVPEPTADEEPPIAPLTWAQRRVTDQ